VDCWLMPPAASGELPPPSGDLAHQMWDAYLRHRRRRA
jgi:hypothetical protein